MQYKKIIEEFYKSVKEGGNPLSLPEEGLEIYRNLIRHTVYEFLSSVFPLTKKITEDKWEDLIESFVSSQNFTSPYLQDLPFHFIEYIEKKDVFKDEEYLKDLLRYEWLEVEIFNQDVPLKESEFSWQNTYRLSNSARAVVFQYPVHHISQIGITSFKHKKGRYNLIIYQNPESFEVEYIQLTDFLYEILNSLESGNLYKISTEISVKYSVNLELISNHMEKFFKTLIKNRIII
ncbi:hypothetical protein SAMN06265182_0312 [Persephonella hydrogeniphila]|uniref:Putative DNA-binding domain-containing protein n=1 Tax=Persephonella hydrogeniphila TaxID=198703 RepID=A0A285N145_9AQUI|nr:putative DNA-binding domain-containing protein [Persephonella hydrogeniphila]SNZ03172.1 hypothetical protein SAMN06265182_0312 [Persephonella hydrogeniphila]